MNPGTLLLLGGVVVGGYFLLTNDRSSKPKKTTTPRPGSPSNKSPHRNGVTWKPADELLKQAGGVRSGRFVQQLDDYGIDIYTPVSWQPRDLFESETWKTEVPKALQDKVAASNINTWEDVFAVDGIDMEPYFLGGLWRPEYRWIGHSYALGLLETPANYSDFWTTSGQPGSPFL